MQLSQAEDLLRHAGIRLLRSQNAPLLISFLIQIFKSPHRLSILESEIERRLRDFLFELQEKGHEDYPRPAREYLEEWVKNHWLRRSYQQQDEPEYELTPELEQTLTFLLSLEKRRFVGTESRLQTVFKRLREIAEGTEPDPLHRQQTLQSQIQALQAQLERLQQGQWERLDQRRIQEYWQEARETAMRLLGDFRQVEANFRTLDHQFRQKIGLADPDRGGLLEKLFSEHDRIQDSEQGQSFGAFWEFLMHPEHQQELSDLLETLLALPELATETDPFMEKLKMSLVQAADRVKSTQSRLYAQLRRFLLSRQHLEQKQLFQILQQLEGHFLQRDSLPSAQNPFWEADSPIAELRLRYERIPWEIPTRFQIETQEIVTGQGSADWQALLQEYRVDPERLIQQRDACLAEIPEIRLSQILERFPVVAGFSELLTWLQLGLDDPFVVILPGSGSEVQVRDTEAGYQAWVRVPELLFSRPPEENDG